MRYSSAVAGGIQLSSGRAIALGRLMLAVLFMVAVWIDLTQPARAPVATYALLGGYIAFAAAVATATWASWWFDAHLAGPAHAVDIVVFTALASLTAGYTSPFFVFFVFLLLAAAIRWGWKETALTAILLTLLYLVAGVIAARSGTRFQLYQFVIRTGDLVILSLILIWFGVSRWTPIFVRHPEDQISQSTLDKSPLETALRAAIRNSRARAGALIWRAEGSSEASVLSERDGQLSTSVVKDRSAAAAAIERPVLYDSAKDRGLTKDGDRNLVSVSPAALLGPQFVQSITLNRGIAIPIATEAGSGLLFLEGVRGLSTDHIDAGEQVAREVAGHLQRRALLKAVDESAEARSRLSLARDLHDSVVQFLAGAAFRIEAMRRAHASGRALESDLDELKTLMLQEQGELRSFITTLRKGSQVTMRDFVADMQSLADRLSRQWDVNCALSAHASDLLVPTRLQIEAHQLVREAVANAVRHAGAKSIQIAVGAESNALQLQLTNDGAPFPRRGKRIEPPRSLMERVQQAGGSLDVSRGMDVTKLSISLPLAARLA